MKALGVNGLNEMARHIRIHTNPLSFASVCGFDNLDEWQRDVLCSTTGNYLLNITRQGGKSQITALLALWHALTTDNALVLVVSPSERQSKEFMRRVLDAYHKIDATHTDADAVTKLTLELKNESRIIALPSQSETIRGYSKVTLLIVDEAARVEDEIFQAIRPMLSVSRGRMVWLSTPFGKQGSFYRAWTSKVEEWNRVKITALECPRITDEFLEGEKIAMLGWQYQQEYFCEFEANEFSVFDYDKVEQMARPNVEYWNLDDDEWFEGFVARKRAEQVLRPSPYTL